MFKPVFRTFVELPLPRRPACISTLSRAYSSLT